MSSKTQAPMNNKFASKNQSPRLTKASNFPVKKLNLELLAQSSKHSFLTTDDISHLQRTIGNQAISRRLELRSQSKQRAEREQEEVPVRVNEVTIDTPSGRAGKVPYVQRVVEVRPPGRSEASAFGRRQELIDRLNRQSPAMQYRLDGRALRYNIVNEAALTNFDRQMRNFVDRAEVVPMRLITRGGRVEDRPNVFVPLLVDSLALAYVDLDDMLASDDLSFQMNLVHFLAERFRVRNYERRIGTNMDADFRLAHRAGFEAETELLRSVIGDPTIRFVRERDLPGSGVAFVFRSREGYQVMHVFRRAGGAQAGGEVFVRTRDRRRLTIEALRAERAAAPPAGGPR